MPRIADPLTHFMSKVDQTSDPRGCWLWTGGVFKNGYAAFYTGGKMVRAHRFMVEAMHVPIDEGKMALHTCDNRRCVNPAHLYVGTREQNTQDAIERGRFASGDRNGMRTHPERHVSKVHPERMARGERSNQSQLTEDDIREIRAAYQNGMTLKALGAQYGITYQAIQKIVRRRSWTHVL